MSDLDELFKTESKSNLDTLFEPAKPKVGGLDKKITDLTPLIPDDLLNLRKIDEETLGYYDNRIKELENKSINSITVGEYVREYNELNNLKEKKQFRSNRIKKIDEIQAGKSDISQLPALPKSKYDEEKAYLDSLNKPAEFQLDRPISQGQGGMATETPLPSTKPITTSPTSTLLPTKWNTGQGQLGTSTDIPKTDLSEGQIHETLTSEKWNKMNALEKAGMVIGNVPNTVLEMFVNFAKTVMDPEVVDKAQKGFDEWRNNGKDLSKVSPENLEAFSAVASIPQFVTLNAIGNKPSGIIAGLGKRIEKDKGVPKEFIPPETLPKAKNDIGDKELQNQLDDIIWNKAYKKVPNAGKGVVEGGQIPPEKPSAPPTPKAIPPENLGKRQTSYARLGDLNESQIKDLENRKKLLGYEDYKIKTHADTRKAVEDLQISPEELIKSKRILSREEVVKMGDAMDTESNNIFKLNKQLEKATPKEKIIIQKNIDNAEIRLNEIIKKVLPNATETAQALEAHRILTKKILVPEFWIKRAEKIGNRPLSEQQISIIKELCETKDRGGLTQFISMMRTPTLAEKGITLWKAGLLTSPTTHLANIAGNIGMAGLETISDIVSAPIDMIASLISGKRSMSISHRTIAGKFKGLVVRGPKESGKFLKTGVYSNEILNKYDIPQDTHFNNPLLNIYTKSIFRLLGAEDILSRESAIQESLVKQAEVKAGNLGLKGKAYNKKIKALLQNPTDDMVKNAINDAEYSTFQGKNIFASAISGVKKSALKSGSPIGQALYSGLEMIAPFTKTPINIAGAILDYSPVGFVKALLRIVKPSTASQKAIVKVLGRAITGTGVIGLGAILEKQGLMTGNAPENKAERDMFYAEGKQPNSFKRGDKWYSLNRISPVGNLLGIGANLEQLSKEKSGLELGTTTVTSGIKGLTEQTFLKGVSSGLGAITEPERKAGSFLESTVSSLIPSVVTRIGKTIDPTTREHKGIIPSLQERIPWLRERLPPKRDIFGEPVTVPGGSFNLIDPFARTKAKDNPIINEFRKVKATIGLPSNKIAQTTLSPEEYDKYLEVLGKSRKEILTEVINDPGYQEAEPLTKEKYLKRITDKIKDQVDMEYFPKLMVARYNLPKEFETEPLNNLFLLIQKENEKFNKLSLAEQEKIVKDKLTQLGYDVKPKKLGIDDLFKEPPKSDIDDLFKEPPKSDIDDLFK